MKKIADRSGSSLRVAVECKLSKWGKNENKNLYRATIPSRPYVIKNGYLYTRIENEDTGEELVKRYKIKNWEEIKEGK